MRFTPSAFPSLSTNYQSGRQVEGGWTAHGESLDVNAGISSRSYTRGAFSHASTVGNVDVQLWIAEGARPLPMRVVLTYVDEPGQPQYRANFEGWKTGTSGGPDAFRFSPPKDARRIVFASQLPSDGGAARRGDTEAGR